jgi:hypothetical protein
MVSTAVSRREFIEILCGAGAIAALPSAAVTAANVVEALSPVTPVDALIESYQQYLLHKNTVEQIFEALSWRPAAQVLGLNQDIGSRIKSLDSLLDHVAQTIINGASVRDRLEGISREEIEEIKANLAGQAIDTCELNKIMTRGGRPKYSNLIQMLNDLGPSRLLAASGSVQPGFDYKAFAGAWRDALLNKIGETSPGAIEVVNILHRGFISDLVKVTGSFDRRPSKKVENANQEHSPASQPNAPTWEAWKILADGYGQAAQSTFSDLVVPKPKPEY